MLGFLMESTRQGHRCSHASLVSVAILLSVLSSHVVLTDQTHSHLHQAAQEAYQEDGGDQLPRVYIVFVRQPPHMASRCAAEREAWHESFLPTLTLAASGKPRLVYSYRSAISGFAAWLTPREVEAMREMEGFLDAEPDAPLQLETTHTPRFLGLANESSIWRRTSRGAERLIGVMDNGIDHTHVSFSGAGMPEFPRGWSGTCAFNCPYGTTCTCTKKLLGAMVFNKTGTSALPDERSSHGTAVASVAAGDYVSGALYKNYAEGTASGAAPGAYLSFYGAHTVAGYLDAIEQAIDNDKVEVLSISMSCNNSVTPFYGDAFAIGALRAVEAGVLVSIAAGNSGPEPGSVRNLAPWHMTVGACTTDRALEVTMELHGAARHPIGFYGVSQADPDEVLEGFTSRRRLVYPGATGDYRAMTCNVNLNEYGVEGAIVLCWRGPNASPFVQAANVEGAGGEAMVLMNDWKIGEAFHLAPFLPVFTVAMRHRDSNRIVGYFQPSAHAGPPLIEAFFSPSGSRFGVHPYPVVADFSGRGRSGLIPGILKPDVVGPGVSVLVAANNTGDKFALMSGTSIATPHLSAVAALLKSRQPCWTPAAIRSAIMTTADTTDSLGRHITDYTGHRARFYAMGAGLVNPQRAADPGLVYDIPDTDDYLRFVCSLGYDQDRLDKFALPGERLNCSELGVVPAEQLNYPSITVVMDAGKKKRVIRTVTNVGPSRSLYKSTVDDVPPGVRVTVFPNHLSFTASNQRERFTVIVEVEGKMAAGRVIDAYLRWESQRPWRVVTSPLCIVFP